MKRSSYGADTARLLLISVCAMSMLSACAKADKSQPVAQETLAKSHVLADQFQSRLQSELSEALSTVGPVGAIGVCQQVAPAIAADLSEQSGANVSRVAVRNRNPGNGLPAEWAQMYAQLEDAPLRNGAPASVHRQLETGAVFMRAIPMKDQPCAQCHGTQIMPEVSAAIDQAYPGDTATGFERGDLRGAFVIQWPASL